MFRPRLPFALSSRCRTYATRRPEKPPARFPDPLKNTSNAVVTTLQDDNNLTFIYRPPPSVPSPHSTTLDPASPLLKPRTPSNGGDSGPLPPLLRPSSYKPELERVSREVIEKIRALRLSQPRTHSRTKLAKMFNCTPNFISKVAALPRPQRKQFMGELKAEHAAVRGRWGERKATVVAIRQKRREFW